MQLLNINTAAAKTPFTHLVRRLQGFLFTTTTTNNASPNSSLMAFLTDTNNYISTLTIQI